jgi:hypothetical protein
MEFWTWWLTQATDLTGRFNIGPSWKRHAPSADEQSGGCSGSAAGLAYDQGWLSEDIAGRKGRILYALEHYLHCDGANIHTWLVNRGQRRTQQFRIPDVVKADDSYFLRYGATQRV